MDVCNIKVWVSIVPSIYRLNSFTSVSWPPFSFGWKLQISTINTVNIFARWTLATNTKVGYCSVRPLFQDCSDNSWSEWSLLKSRTASLDVNKMWLLHKHHWLKGQMTHQKHKWKGPCMHTQTHTHRSEWVIGGRWAAGVIHGELKEGRPSSYKSNPLPVNP